MAVIPSDGETESGLQASSPFFKEMSVKRTQVLWLLITLLTAGCGGASVKSYHKSDAAWATIQHVAVLPFELPSENPVQRQLIGNLFAEELRRRWPAEITEIPLSSPVGSGLMDVRQVGKQHRVDAVFSGSIDDTHGTVVHVRLQDAATEDLLWSGTFTLGVRAEFFSFATQQQQFQRAFRALVRRFVSQAHVRSAPRAKAGPR